MPGQRRDSCGVMQMDRAVLGTHVMATIPAGLDDSHRLTDERTAINSLVFYIHPSTLFLSILSLASLAIFIRASFSTNAYQFAYLSTEEQKEGPWADMSSSSSLFPVRYLSSSYCPPHLFPATERACVLDSTYPLLTHQC